MYLQEILEKNKQFNQWEKEIESTITNKREEIKTLNQTIDLEEFKSLGYEKAKIAWKELEFNTEYNQRPKFQEVLQQLKEETYPILKKAHFYPIINNIDFLTDYEKHSLDELLHKLGPRSYIHLTSSCWYNLNFDDDKTQKVLDFLYENNIIGKSYKLYCECKDSCKILDEEEWNNHKKYFEIQTRLNTLSNITREEELWSSEFEDNELLTIIDCDFDRCDGRELESWNDFEKNCVVLYKVKAIADTTYSSK